MGCRALSGWWRLCLVQVVHSVPRYAAEPAVAAQDFMAKCQTVSEQLLECFAIALGEDPAYFVQVRVASGLHVSTYLHQMCPGLDGGQMPRGTCLCLRSIPSCSRFIAHAVKCVAKINVLTCVRLLTHCC